MYVYVLPPFEIVAILACRIPKLAATSRLPVNTLPTVIASVFCVLVAVSMVPRALPAALL